MATIRQGRRALVVIDVQNDVMAQAWRRDEVIANIVALIDDAREADVPVIFVQHEADDELVNGTEGWRFVDAIVPREGEPLIHKRFLDAFVETDLPQVLSDLDISHLVVTGAQSMACIRATTNRAMAEGYDLTLVADAHTTDDLDWDGVTLSAEQIVGYTNLCLGFTTYPGQEIQAVRHDAVAFAAPVVAGKDA